MKLTFVLLCCITSVLVVSCTGGKVEPSPESSAVQSPESPVAVSASRQAESTQPVEKFGTFVSGEQPTQGTVRLVTRNGQSLLELGQDFVTSELGPDLVVILHRSDDVIGSTQPPAYPLQEGDYVVLAPLQQFKGTQSYPIPATVNLADYRSAGIWCRKFNATFGAAVLKP